MFIPSFKILAIIVPEKTPTQILMLTCYIGKERKMDKNSNIRVVTLSLNPTIQSFILHMYTIFEDSSWHSSGENSDTNLALKDRKMDK